MRWFLALFLACFAADYAACAQQLYGIPATSMGAAQQALSLAVTTVKNLPVCDQFHAGALRAVSDATSPTYGSTLTGGGTVGALAYCNGSAWTAR